MIAPIEPPAWTVSAACASVDPDLWYPEQGQPTKHARRICGECPVKVQCLQMALDNGERWGIFGGLDEKQRRRLRRAS